ncbi:MAG: type II toxin-antitoxin system RelB/DinJ family antitoxin [Clostridia bacterium]|nr:type II toxin-antitoxin system RelB/DinJ family antitoxin [Clostridia bacterium]
MKTATVSAYVDKDVKERAEAILSQLGLSVSDAINLLYHQIILRKGLPFPIDLPDEPQE